MCLVGEEGVLCRCCLVGARGVGVGKYLLRSVMLVSFCITSEADVGRIGGVAAYQSSSSPYFLPRLSALAREKAL